MARETRIGSKAAVLVDAENQSDLDPQELLHLLVGYNVEEKHAYADWRDGRLARLAHRLDAAGFTRHDAPSGYRPGVLKNTADGYMARGTAELLARRRDIRVVVIVSGDAYFCRLVHLLRDRGRHVIVAAGPERVNQALLTEASEYLPTGALARALRGLYELEQGNAYVTFSFAVQQLGLPSQDLARLIARGYLGQGLVTKPGRGTRPEIWLDRRSAVVRRTLGVAA